MRFIDLFAGIGGFHLALHRLGHTCVFACELDGVLRDTYYRNFGIMPLGDIRELAPEMVPEHEILCAGFPCQPFSKAGDQGGFDDPEWGDLFYHMLDILRTRQPAFFILENVANFEKHDGGQTWAKARRLLETACPHGYQVQIKKLSPHHFGIPQIRERVIIVGTREGLEHFHWPQEGSTGTSIRAVLDHNPAEARKIPAQVTACLEVWQRFLNGVPPDEGLPSFPIWSMEFAATYPFEDTTPWAIGAQSLSGFLGSHGVPLIGHTFDDIESLLPSYARTREPRFPEWKIQFIRQNREFYQKHNNFLDTWMSGILPFPQSFQKLEWNCKGEPRDLRRYVIQIRASGVRVKRPTTAPSLVAMTSTQVPIISWEGRYMTPRECARLQSMEALEFLPSAPTAAYRALGNAVNVRVIELVARSLITENAKLLGVAPPTAALG